MLLICSLKLKCIDFLKAHLKIYQHNISDTNLIFIFIFCELLLKLWHILNCCNFKLQHILCTDDIKIYLLGFEFYVWTFSIFLLLPNLTHQKVTVNILLKIENTNIALYYSNVKSISVNFHWFPFQFGKKFRKWEIRSLFFFNKNLHFLCHICERYCWMYEKIEGKNINKLNTII